MTSLVYMVPKMWAGPALDGPAAGQPLSIQDTGSHSPVVGVGPLLRVLRVREVDGQKIGVDPFTGERLAVLSGADAVKAGRARYVIQNFGYSATATKTLSMTFDDGPDPKVTPELLNVLSANKTPATFFVVGENAAKYPEIVAREVREGHAVGIHTLTHPNIASEPTWREHIELVATNRVLRAITRQESGFWRMPYQGNDEASQQDSINGFLRAQRLGYTVAAYDFDTLDWEGEANPQGRVGEIPLPDLDSSANITMLMHDAGGPNRMRTVEYVKKLIPYAKAHGYTFQTMPQVDPALAAGIHSVKPAAADHATLYVVKALFVWPNAMVSALFVFAMLAVVLVGFGTAGLAWMRHHRRRRIVFPGPEDVGLRTSVVLAAFNEEPVIARTLRSILSSDYPILEVIVVDDGSADGTAEEVRTVMAQDSRVVLLQQPNTGKSHALNRGVEHASGDFVVTLDADTIMTSATVTNMIRHFALDGAGRLGAVAGVVRVGNRETNLLTRWQALEYLTMIGVERSAQDALGAISIIPGACAAWRKEAILDAGGYSDTTLAEDCDLALMMHRLGWRVTQDDEALAYTEAPETVDDLLAQRTRWTFGTLQAIWKHQGMLFRRKYGALGCYVLPNYVLSVVMPVIFLPFVVAMGWLAVHEQGWGVLIEYFMLFMLIHAVIAAVAVRLMGEKYHHLLMVPVYRLAFEPLRAYLLYTSVSLAIKGKRMGWKKLARTGSMDTNKIAAGLDDRLLPAEAARVHVPADVSSALVRDPQMTIPLVRPQQPSPQPATQGRPTTQPRARERYVDSLLALALIGVIARGVFEWAWLPILFPSMGIMFAIAGSLMASWLDRSRRNPWRVLMKGTIRLLSPLWLFGLVCVPTMLAAGWTYSKNAGAPLSWQTLLFWIVPISDPPGSQFGHDWVTPLWYIRTYLWFLLLSPATLWLFRHWPKRMVALPVAVVLVSTQLSALGLLPITERAGDVILSLAMFGGCWMLGFAHHDNRIRPLPFTRVLIGAMALMALGLTWAFTHPDPVTAYDIDEIPIASSLYCLGAVLILLRLHPDFSWMDRRVVLDKLVTVITSRAMTIYLWSNVAIFLANPLLDLWSVTADLDQERALGYLQMFLASWLIVIGCIFTFGWCEDLAARRRPRINPWPTQQGAAGRWRPGRGMTRSGQESRVPRGRAWPGPSRLL